MNTRQFLMDQSYDCAEEFLADPRIASRLPPMDGMQLALLRQVMASCHARGRTEGILWSAAETTAKPSATSDSTAARPPTHPAPHE